MPSYELVSSLALDCDHVLNNERYHKCVELCPSVATKTAVVDRRQTCAT